MINMSIQYISDKVPNHIYNSHTTYENTVLQEHSGIVSGLKDTGTSEAMIENQGRLFIGLCLIDNADKFIEDNYQTIYDKEIEKAAASTTADKKTIAVTRTWIKLMNMASSECINKYKIAGSKAKIAVIDDVLPTGGVLLESNDPRVAILAELEKQAVELLKNVKTPKPLEPVVEFTENETGC